MGQVDIINRITNGIVVAIGALIVSDWLSIKAGFAMNGIFAFGSIGTLAFTLASQGLVTELISGLTLLFGNKMKVGDDVIFGDGISGKVLRVSFGSKTKLCTICFRVHAFFYYLLLESASNDLVHHRFLPYVSPWFVY